MGNAAYLHVNDNINEGATVPLTAREITYLHRVPPYNTPPETNLSSDSNTVLTGINYNGNSPTIFGNLEAYKKQCNPLTPPSTVYTRVFAGFNSIAFLNPANINQWTWLSLSFGYLTGSIATTGFKLIFADGSKYIIKDAIDNGYLSPLCLLIGGNWATLYSTGNMATRSFPINHVVCKPLLYNITGVEFTVSITPYWGGVDYDSDGFYAFTYDSTVKFSLNSISLPKRIRNIKHLNTTEKRAGGVFYNDVSSQKRVNL